MLSNWNIALDHVDVFLWDYARNIKKAISLLKTSSVPYFIHTLQLVNKNSLFEDNHIKLLLAKVRKLVCHFSHYSKASEMLNKNPDRIWPRTNKTKSLASCLRCEYKIELNISYAKVTKKAKIKCPVLCG